MGFDSWFFARLEYEDKNTRVHDQSMNFLWRPFSEHFGKEKQIFTSTMRDHYCWIGGFTYDERFDNDDPMVDDKTSDVDNADQKMGQFFQYVSDMEQDYRGNHMLIPFGCDFTFANARLNFEQMDLIIKYINKHNDQNVTLLYSTPQEYIDALHSQNITWPTKYDDMFPYGDNPYDYWSGYYSSRMLAKQQVRDGQAQLHTTNQIYSMVALNQSSSDEDIQAVLAKKDELMDIMGVYQHHDAISGTAKQQVADNYVYHLAKAIEDNFHIYADYLLSEMQRVTGLSSSGLQTAIMPPSPKQPDSTARAVDSLIQ
mmetsp:Transcript_7739/g.12986  ORF Transcript_7739/g.12986 Transcript_7739/m.12986 type:complete len:313 (+) Transcript_7739:581-1519(+)